MTTKIGRPAGTYKLHTCPGCQGVFPTPEMRTIKTVMQDGRAQATIRSRIIGRYCALCAAEQIGGQKPIPSQAIQACEFIVKAITPLAKPKNHWSRVRQKRIWATIWPMYRVAWRGLHPMDPIPLGPNDFNMPERKLKARKRTIEQYLCACGKWFQHRAYFKHRRSCIPARAVKTTPRYERERATDRIRDQNKDRKTDRHDKYTQHYKEGRTWKQKHRAAAKDAKAARSNGTPSSSGDT